MHTDLILTAGVFVKFFSYVSFAGVDLVGYDRSDDLNVFTFIISIDISVQIEVVDSTFYILWKWQARFAIKSKKWLC